MVEAGFIHVHKIINTLGNMLNVKFKCHIILKLTNYEPISIMKHNVALILMSSQNKVFV